VTYCEDGLQPTAVGWFCWRGRSLRIAGARSQFWNYELNELFPYNSGVPI